MNILHLSDIHFKYELDGSVYDLDHDVRNELIIDVREVTRHSGSIDAVVVTGDIAFAGTADDYLVAQHWLKELCESVGCEAEHVWVVPGNHDVDRGKVTPFVRSIQDSIQTASLNDIDNKIREVVYDDSAGEEVLMRPMSEYSKFSAIFGCAPTTAELAWQSDLDLGEGYILRLVGLNSALVSNSSDHEINRKLVVGRAQLTLPRKPGILYMTLCHHPLRWLKDAENLTGKLRNRVLLQLYGHVHQHEIQQNDCTLIVQAGALQPDRREDPWYPSYNILKLEMDTEGLKHNLSITAYPRIWSDNHQFVANPVIREGQVQTFSLPLDDKLSLAKSSTSIDETESTHSKCLEIDEERVDMSYSMKDPAKQLVYAYLTLPYTLQMHIAAGLELLSDDDAGLSSDALFEQIFLRAKQRDLLPELWKQVSVKQPNLKMDDNPYNHR